ncbi:MAG TPA: hypothetical protein DER09_06490 [Prolixibacteraceae bacterium]|nr:hypothetical protein [Prolixibacteraceae bacterium]
MIKKYCFLSFALTVVLLAGFNPLFAQEDNWPKLKINLSEDGSSYFGITMNSQVWTRYISNNPDKNGVAQYSDIDLGIRRSRLTLYANLMDKAMISTQMGYDGMTYRSERKPGFNLYNVEVEYFLLGDALHLGFGLDARNGISRYSGNKNFEFLVVDAPGFTSPVGGTFDDFGRQLGIFARGSISKLHYSFAITKPLEYGVDSVSSPVTTERINENFALKSYFEWQFFDTENALFQQMTMNNLGRGKILNVGAGFYYHPEAMLVEAEKDLSTVDPMLAAMLIAAGSEHLLPQFADYYPSQISDIFVAAADVFIDMPTRRGGAVTGYLGYYYNFFGQNYLRSFGRMNVSKMSAEAALPQGPGNSEWEIGTGHIVRGEFGYLLPGSGVKNRFQPYGAFTFKAFEGLGEASVQFDAGINWLMYGHNLKWTLQYSSRPVYTEVDDQQMWTSSKGQVILQTQIYF